MIVRAFTIVAVASALSLAACPAEATDPRGVIAAGTQLDRITPQRDRSDGTIQLPETTSR